MKNYKEPIIGYWSGATIRNGTFTDMPQGVLVFRDNTEGAVFDGSVPPDSEMWHPGRAVNNVFVGNSSNGIRSEIPGLEVGGNTARRNGGYGIYAPGAVDLGMNVASRNRLGQWVGVVCSAG